MRPALSWSVALSLCGACAIAHGGSCRVESSGLAFGAITTLGPRGAPAPARTSDVRLVVSCTGIQHSGPYTLSLVDATSQGATHRLPHRNGQSSLPVLLFVDPGLTQPWGDGLGGGRPLSGVIPAGDSRQTHMIFGLVPAGQSQARVGDYLAHLTVRLQYTP